MIFWTADQHFLHEAIIGHCDRPFKNSNEQTRIITAKHNSVVKPTDTVYHLGDIFWGGPENILNFKRLLSKLNGTHILILGNHDNLHALKYVDIGFQSAHTTLETVHTYKDKYYTIIMAHDPAIWNAVPHGDNMIFLHGHIHNLYKSMWEGKKVVNVGVDVWDFYPVPFERILRVLRIVE